jgi:RHS repeat-associated protein
MWNTRRLDVVSGYYLYKYRHYDPQLGRWPSRDPIEENGGANLYAFVGNNGVNRSDKLGLEFKNNGLTGITLEARAKENWTNTQLGGTPKFYKDKPEKREGTENEVVKECENPGAEEETYKVYIKSSIEYNVTVHGKYVDDQTGMLYTSLGLSAIMDHEERRLTAYSIGYEAYLKIFEGEITKKCPKSGLTATAANNYKRKLEKWLEEKQKISNRKFQSWTKEQQEMITGENSSFLNQIGKKWEYGDLYLFDAILNPHPDGTAEPLDFTCPK